MNTSKVIVSVICGLGNQMFQYALYRYLRLRNINAYIDTSWYTGKNFGESWIIYSGKKAHETFRLPIYFNLPDLRISTLNDYKHMINEVHQFYFFIKRKFFWEVCQKILRKVKNILIKIPYPRNKLLYVENRDNREFYLNGITRDTESYLGGFFQCYQIPFAIRETLLNDFSFNQPIPADVQSILNDIEGSNSVSIHVRGGDNIENKNVFYHSGSICAKKYYQNAVDYLKTRYNNLRFFIFSDDPAWAKENMNFLDNYIMVNTLNEKNSDYYDMFLMSKAKHNIIANSTFSWWAAFLNQNISKVVLVPHIWLRDDNTVSVDEICPPEWVRVMT